MASDDDELEVLDFSQQQELAHIDGWLQARYYGEEGRRVSEILAYASVYEINPFEVDAHRPVSARAYAQRLKQVVRLFELEALWSRAFHSLSNGEMRRVLFARAVLKFPKHLWLRDPMAGLDALHRERFKRIIRALVHEGLDIRMTCQNADELPGTSSALSLPTKKRAAHSASQAPIVIEIRNLHLAFGRRKLFDGFSWVVRQGERWALTGPNGSGKTTLLALITGDSPLAYANEVTVFGVPRQSGYSLAAVRRRMAMVSPEQQTYGSLGPEELLQAALAAEPDLLILDEPCLNLEAAKVRRITRQISAWLRARPQVTAICVAHREDHIPSLFNLEVKL